MQITTQRVCVLCTANVTYAFHSYRSVGVRQFYSDFQLHCTYITRTKSTEVRVLGRLTVVAQTRTQFPRVGKSELYYWTFFVVVCRRPEQVVFEISKFITSCDVHVERSSKHLSRDESRYR